MGRMKVWALSARHRDGGSNGGGRRPADRGPVWWLRRESDLRSSTGAASGSEARHDQHATRPSHATSCPPPFSMRPFRAYRWAWPLMFYGGIGLGYFGDEFYGVASGTGPAFAPGEAPEGGLQLAVEPRRAAVYVDGVQVGTVDDFDGYYHHLSLTSGPHRIVILLDGYEPLSIDTVITPGRTSTYRGSLMRAPGR